MTRNACRQRGGPVEDSFVCSGEMAPSSGETKPKLPIGRSRLWNGANDMIYL